MHGPLNVKNQLDAQLILSIFRQTLHVSGVFRPIIRWYNRMYAAFGTYCSFYMTLCCPDGPRYALNMSRLTKYTKSKLCIMMVFLYTVISRCTVNIP